MAGPEDSGNLSASQTVEQEILRRRAAMQTATEALEQGDQAMANGNAARACELYAQAASLPEAPMTLAIRQAAAKKLSGAVVIHAADLGREGKFQEASALIENALVYSVDDPALRKLKAQLKDADFFNPAMTAEHAEKVKQIQKLFQLAEGHVDLADYDPAAEAYHQILRLDSTNAAARRGLERVERLVKQYLQTAKDHNRATLLRAVDEQWEVAVPKGRVNNVVDGSNNGSAGPSALSSPILDGIIIPRMSMDGASVDDAISYLRSQAKVNLIVSVNNSPTRPITLDVSNVPLRQALNYIADHSGTRWRLDGKNIVITGLTNSGGAINTRIFSVPPDFLSGAAAPAASEGDPFSNSGTAATGAVQRVTAQSFLEGNSIPFPPGASANFVRGTSRLVVKNTDDNLDMVAALVEQLRSKAPKQVLVQVWMLTISETKLDEIGFDWLMGGFNAGSSGVFGSGGTYSNSGLASTLGSQYPLFLPTGTTNAPTPIGGNPITAGLRSSADLTRTTIDELVRGLPRAQNARTRSPGAFALTGAFTDPQFQTVLRALNQKKGIDALASTSVILKSGARATATSLREVPYPTDFDPPQIPQNFAAGQSVAAPVTPTTPTGFEKKEVGLKLEVSANIAEDGNLIDLELTPEFSEFDGFINYGSPITSGDGNGNNIVLTTNEIIQPVVSVISMPATSVAIYDGAVLTLGGLKEGKSTLIEDKVPIFGDLPMIGRLFRSNVRENVRKNILIFVQAKILDPSGQLISEQLAPTDAPALGETP
jgi:general secretion pathway protein D